MDDDPWDWSFWDGPGPDELVEFLGYERLFGQVEGVALLWRVYMADQMRVVLLGLGYARGK
jgi:hypothetical protein